ncbi:MAG: Na-translocating system protein MpsC family protein [Planctomycetota bacterium]|jgi:uncharacterized protein YbcI
MDESESSRPRLIAQAAWAFEQRTTGRSPSSVTVVLIENSVVITLRGTLSPAEIALAKSQESATQLRELHRQLFTTAAEPLRLEIREIIGVDVREATAEVEISTGTVVQVFTLAHAVPADTWSGRDPGAAKTEKESNSGTGPAGTAKSSE